MTVSFPLCVQLARKVNLRAAAKNGTTALHWAAARNQYAVVQLLLLEGADATQKAKDGRTPLHWCAHARCPLHGGVLMRLTFSSHPAV